MFSITIGQHAIFIKSCKSFVATTKADWGSRFWPILTDYANMFQAIAFRRIHANDDNVRLGAFDLPKNIRGTTQRSNHQVFGVTQSLTKQFGTFG